MKIVFLDAATLGDTPLDEIAALGELVAWPSSTHEQALGRVGDCEVLIVNKVRVDAALLERAPRLRLICEAATGVNNIDLEAAAARGIPVRNAAGYSTDAVVQSTFAHLLSLAGYSPYFDDCVKSGRYSAGKLFCDISHPYVELSGKTLGIIGLGTIGARVAAVATAFGMRVIYYSTSGTSHSTLYPSVPLDELLAQADAVSIHAPLNARTSGLIGAAQLRRMKPTAFLLNLGRGGIVDEAALAEAVDAGLIAGAALDVYASEPLAGDSPLLRVRHPERFRFTPHTAWASREALRRLVHQVAENICGTVLEID
ncbi:MAG: hydroxyacid dehydrogenase [Bacteroidales bacterium]|nr:hydroxyacid dehydrogenase [Bacteroidales bacterium]